MKPKEQIYKSFISKISPFPEVSQFVIEVKHSTVDELFWRKHIHAKLTLVSWEFFVVRIKNAVQLLVDVDWN
jgi:hypothetical protein